MEDEDFFSLTRQALAVGTAHAALAYSRAMGETALSSSRGFNEMQEISNTACAASLYNLISLMGRDVRPAPVAKKTVTQSRDVTSLVAQPLAVS